MSLADSPEKALPSEQCEHTHLESSGSLHGCRREAESNASVCRCDGWSSGAASQLYFDCPVC